MLKRVRFILFCLMIAAAALLLGWPSRPREVVPKDFVEVRYWEKWTSLEAEQMKQIVDKFNATVGREKKIYVSYLSLSGVDQKTLLATAAGVPPDIAGVWDRNVAQFGGMGALEPLEEMARTHTPPITREDYKPVFWEGCSYDGHLYALPSTPGVVALHYNKGIFRKKAAQLREAGLDPDRAPRTLQEFDRYAAVLDTLTADGSLVAAGYLPQEPGWWLAIEPYWFSGDMYDPATRKVKLTTPEVIRAFEWVQSYTKRLGIANIRRYRSVVPKDMFDSPQSPFFSGMVAMEKEGSWKANYVQKHNPKMANIAGYTPEQLSKLTRQQRRDNADWGVAPFPAADVNSPPVTYGGMDVLVIPSTSKHKKEAFEFLAFVNRQDIMEKLISLHCKDSPLAKMSDAYIQNHPNPYVEIFEELAASPNAKPLPRLPVWPEVSAEIDYAVEQVCNDPALNVPDLLKKTEIKAQAIVDRYFERTDQRAKLEARR